jgi:tetratricopeptide (TPR) repeat protein/transcriptional regulator with XRE-family HTH domain
MTTRQPSPFGKVLRGQRRAAGLTQEALAERAGLGANTIRALEAGVNQAPRQETLDLLVEALAVARHLSAADRASLASDFAAAIQTARMEEAPTPVSGATPPLVGRRRELALIEQHLAGSGPPLLLLAGEPGIGKSRLLREAATRAARIGWQVVEGGCQRRGGQEPFAPLLQALERHIQQLQTHDLRAALQGCAWLVRLLPELAAGPIEPLPSWTLPPEQERRLLFKAVARYLANVAGPTGTLLVLDDLQWAGIDALDLLATLAREDETPLRVVGAYRDTEVSLAPAPAAHPLALLLADLAHADLATHRAVGPLATEDALELLETLLEGAGEEQAAHLLERASGVPFFLISCARGLRAGDQDGHTGKTLPWNVAQSIRQRVAALPSEAQAILGIAAVAGRVAPIRLLVAASEQPEREVLVGLDAACRAQLLEESGAEACRFVHDVIREVVEADLSAVRRAVLHRRMAETLERERGEMVIEALAFHYARGGDRRKAALYLEQAGDRAWKQRAQAAAEAFFRDAVGHLDSVEQTLGAARLREKLAAVLGQSARPGAALEELAEAAEGYRLAGELESLGRVAAHIGDLHAQAGTPEQGMQLLQPLIEVLESGMPSAGQVALYLALTDLYYRSGRYVERLEAANRAVEVARILRDDRLLAAALATRGSSLQLLSRLRESLESFQEAMALMQASGDLDDPGARPVALGTISTAAVGPGQRNGLNLIGQAVEVEPWLVRYDPALILGDSSAALFSAGRFQDGTRAAEFAVGIAERRGDPRHVTWSLGIRAFARIATGDWEGAQADVERSVTIYSQLHLSARFALGIGVRGFLYMLTGRWAEAMHDLHEITAISERSGDLQMLRVGQGTLAEIEIREGQPAAAVARLQPLLDRPGLEEEDVTALLPLLAWAHIEMGEATEATAWAERAIVRARTEGSPWMLVDALRVQVLIALRQGRWAEAAPLIEEGISLARAMPYPYAEGRLLHLAGLLHSQRGEPDQARADLQAALAIFRGLGARADIERAEEDCAAVPLDARA